jgi:TPR repeat protein
VAWYKKAEAQGSARADEMLGWCYYKGQGVSADADQAGKYLQKAVDRGNLDALRYLNLLTKREDGTYVLK